MKPQQFSKLDNNFKYSNSKKTESPSRISSSDILNTHGRLIIEHNDEEYILRITRSGKLILTK